MDAMSFLHRFGRQLSYRLLPSRCLLCDAPGGENIDLCAACRAQLPRNDTCCARCALPLEHPVAQCGACQRHAPCWDTAWVPYCYAWPLDRLQSRYKFAANLAAGSVLGKLWAAQPPPRRPQLIAPVPLHHNRLRRRGYNQTLELAKVLAQRYHLPLQQDLLCRVRATSAQSKLDAVARRRNVRGAFRLQHPGALPAHVAIVDDVMTTGATLSECVRVLKRAGVIHVDVWALARAPRPGPR